MIDDEVRKVRPILKSHFLRFQSSATRQGSNGGWGRETKVAQLDGPRPRHHGTREHFHPQIHTNREVLR